MRHMNADDLNYLLGNPRQVFVGSHVMAITPRSSRSPFAVFLRLLAVHSGSRGWTNSIHPLLPIRNWKTWCFGESRL